jgi:hypothetical protein
LTGFNNNIRFYSEFFTIFPGSVPIVCSVFGFDLICSFAISKTHWCNQQQDATADLVNKFASGNPTHAKQVATSLFKGFK